VPGEEKVELLAFLLIALAVMAAWVWAQMSRRRTRDRSQEASMPELDERQRAIINSAQRLTDVINESLKIANESKNADTKLSRLDVAKNRLDELKRLSKEYPFLKLTRLSLVEKSIADLDQEFLQARYREISDGNMRGQLLEKSGNIDEAILEYERLIAESVDTPFTYRRLAIIYSKLKEKDEELRVLRAAIKNIPIENSAHYQWFAERLAKKV